MAKASGILGVNHVGVFTSRIEEAEKHYAELFGTVVLFRGTTYRGNWVGIDPAYGWEEIRRRGLRVEASFMRAGELTVIVADSPADKSGPINHVGIGCSEGEFRRIKELVRMRGLRMPEEEAEAFKFVDELGLIWEICRGMDSAARPANMLDLGSGRIV